MDKSDLKKIFITSAVILVAIFIRYFSLEALKNRSLNPILIAHAGGSYNGNTLLNSKEAVENAISNGFQYIELDLLESTDGDLIAGHDWKMFHKLTGYPESKAAISVQEAKKRKILNDQTVLTSREIYDIFMSNPNITLVTDKIQNIDLLNEKFADFKTRIIVEVFSIEKYQEVLSKGFKAPAFCVWDKDALYQVVERYHIDMVTLAADNISHRIKWYKKHPNITALAFTSVNGIANSKEEIKKLFPYINGWYTDFLTPDMIKEQDR